MKVEQNVILDEKKKIIQVKDLSKVKPKKISGTNFGVILGYNSFQSPFQAWCDMMKVFKKPYEESLAMKAGKAIEPLQIKYVKDKYNLAGLVTPEEKIGPNYFNKTHGDFFPMDEHFQGMWDCLNMDLQTGSLKSVVEMKTTKVKHMKNWQNEIPFYYILQVCLYAYLSTCDKAVIVASFLEDKDYENPNSFVPNEQNTIIVPYTLNKDIPGFEENYIKPAILWWNKHIVSGISPEYNEYDAGDCEIVKTIKKQLEESNQTQATPKKSSDSVKTIEINDIIQEELPFY